MGELTKQGAVERQQQATLQAQEERETSERFAKTLCASQAETSAIEQYEETCTYNCQEGYYYTANYDNYYKSCLQSRGFDE